MQMCNKQLYLVKFQTSESGSSYSGATACEPAPGWFIHNQDET